LLPGTLGKKLQNLQAVTLPREGAIGIPKENSPYYPAKDVKIL
jgi:hypothetical protein